MSDALKLALTITATDLAGSVLNRLRDKIIGTGEAAKQVQHDFDQMIRHLKAGITGLAIDKYLGDKVKVGVDAAADLQDSLMTVKGLLDTTGKSAGTLAQQMSEVRKNAADLIAQMPYSPKDLIDIQANLIQSGISLNAVTKGGATYAAAAMAYEGKIDPAEAAQSLARVGHAFQIGDSQYGDLGNLLEQTKNTTSATISELLHNMERVGSSAHVLGINPREAAAALATVAPIGEEAGSDLTQFFIGLAGGGRRGMKAEKQLGLNFFDPKTKQFVGIPAAIAILQKKMATLDPQQRMFYMNHLFGTQGMMAGNLLLAKGSKSYASFYQRGEVAPGLKEFMDKRLSSFNAQIEQLQSEGQMALANLFDPMLKPLTKAVELVKEITKGIASWSSDHRNASAVISGTAAVGLGALGVYSAYSIMRGAGAGFKVWRGIKGLGGGLAGGVAEGKALEKVAGVNPVFVTNWPAGGLGGLGNDIPGGALSAIRKFRFAKLLGTGGRLGVLGEVSELGGVAGSVATGISAALVAGAGAFGYLAGHEFNKHVLNKYDWGEKAGNAIGTFVAMELAALGDKTAQDALRTDASTPKVHLQVNVSADKGTKAQVQPVHTQSANVHTTVSTGGG